MKSLPLSSLHSGSTNGFTPYNLPILGPRIWGLMRLRPTHTHSLLRLTHSRYFRLRIWRCSPTNMCTYSILRERTRYSTLFGKQYYILRGYPTPAFQTEFPQKIVEMVPFTFWGAWVPEFWIRRRIFSPLFRSTWAFWCSVVTLIWGKLHHCTGYLSAFGLSGHRCSA